MRPCKRGPSLLLPKPFERPAKKLSWPDPKLCPATGTGCCATKHVSRPWGVRAAGRWWTGKAKRKTCKPMALGTCWRTAFSLLQARNPSPSALSDGTCQLCHGHEAGCCCWSWAVGNWNPAVQSVVTPTLPRPHSCLLVPLGRVDARLGNALFRYGLQSNHSRIRRRLVEEESMRV